MIYFIQDSSTLLIKIGFTDGAASDRLKALQTGCPSGLVLLCAIEGDKAAESRLHAKLASARDRGEWFRPTPDLLSLMLAVAEKDYGRGFREGRACVLAEVKTEASLQVVAEVAGEIRRLIDLHGPLALSLQGPLGGIIHGYIQGLAKKVCDRHGHAGLDWVMEDVCDYAYSKFPGNEIAQTAVANALDHRFDGIGGWSA